MTQLVPNSTAGIAKATGVKGRTLTEEHTGIHTMGRLDKVLADTQIVLSRDLTAWEARQPAVPRRSCPLSNEKTTKITSQISQTAYSASIQVRWLEGQTQK